MGNVDGWGFGFIVFGTATIMAVLPAPAPRGGAAAVDPSAAKAMAQPVDAGVAYKIVIERPRLPADCKGITADTPADVADNCMRIASQDASEIMVPQSQLAQKPQRPMTIMTQPAQIGQ